MSKGLSPRLSWIRPVILERKFQGKIPEKPLKFRYKYFNSLKGEMSGNDPEN